MLRTVTVSRTRPWQGPWQCLWPRPIIVDQTGFALLMWTGFLTLTLGVMVVLARFIIDDVDNLSGSGWESASDAAAWYVAGVVGWSVWHYLPLMVAHGRTRRDAAIELTVFMATFAVFAALLVTLGYAIEAAVYRIGNWTHDIGGQHLFRASTDVHLMVLEYGLTSLVWGSVGALIGAGTYRNDVLGWLTWLPALILVGVAGTITQWYAGPVQFFADRLIDVDTLPLPAVVLFNLACVAAALGMAWPLVRGMPLRNR